jgi:hypothetical protein
MDLKQIFAIYLINFFSYFKQIRKFFTATTKNAFMLLLSQFMSVHILMRVIPLCSEYGFVIKCKQSNPTIVYW